jgi:hypothetical protein
MDTRRHVSITQPPSVAMLGLLGRYVGSQGNRDSTQGARAKARCDAAEEGLTHHPQRVAVERPSDCIRNRALNQPLGRFTIPNGNACLRGS